MERLIFVGLLFAFGCTPQKKLSKLLRKYPELVQQTDTTIYFHTTKTDTNFVFNSASNSDTFYINKTQTKIYRHYDTLRVYTPAKKDSVIITKNIVQVLPDKKGTFVETVVQFFKDILLAIFLLLLPIILLKIQWKKI